MLSALQTTRASEGCIDPVDTPKSIIRVRVKKILLQHTESGANLCESRVVLVIKPKDINFQVSADGFEIELKSSEVLPEQNNLVYNIYTVACLPGILTSINKAFDLGYEDKKINVMKDILEKGSREIQFNITDKTYKAVQ
jgi:hypothetical protein